jgi:hypothetical protein
MPNTPSPQDCVYLVAVITLNQLNVAAIMNRTHSCIHSLKRGGV